jgi:hypothetical protein
MWVTAMPAATQARTSTAMKDFKLAFLGVPPNEWRLRCGALKKDSFLNVRAPPASNAC